MTRRNNRALSFPGGHIRNGALWRIHETHLDGSLDVLPAGASQREDAAQVVRLPATYVREHVELGYASTVHRAQGMTVGRCHVLATGTLTRQSLYVAMTRGRASNHAWVATDTVSSVCPAPDSADAPTGLDVLRKVLATDGNELSATATLRQRREESISLRRLLPIRDLIAKADHDPEAAAALHQLDHVITARTQEARRTATRQTFVTASRNRNREGIRR